MNVVNPALTGRIFLFFAYPAQISGNAVWTGIDGVSTATPLASLTTGGVDALSQAAMKLNGVELASQVHTWKQAFLGFIPGSIGETSALGCLIGAVILLITGVASWRIMASVLGGSFVLVTLLNVIGGSPALEVPFHWHLVVGGFAFGMVFMATDPVSAPALNQAKYLYGFLIGLLVIMVRILNPAFPEGMMMAILFANICAPLFDFIFVNRNIKRRIKQNG
jgi:Na+-transporting NADH:ubiquinone oxidoreductase subunit B